MANAKEAFLADARIKVEQRITHMRNCSCVPSMNKPDVVIFTGTIDDYNAHLSDGDVPLGSDIATLQRVDGFAAPATDVCDPFSHSLKGKPCGLPLATGDDVVSAESISVLVEKEMSKMRRFAWMLVRDNDHADDLVQDTIVRVLTYADQWQPGTNFSAWVKVIMRNLFSTECSLRARDATALMLDQSPREAIAPTQDDRLTCSEMTTAISHLPRNQRVAVSLAAFEGLRSKEIAVRMQISPNAVRCHLMRGRKQLRDVAAAPPDRRPSRVALALATLAAGNS